ncbi:hypothetical protein NGRA_3303 [Nosema granulosis]|uniref:Uncharacterized protein n=1 Tax=Nosema granulosis TaxID=83296 RepID=A0A9P6GV03_9MICR|nr:hypothetical protein NGRA_3303 [Nosema granulosis]
MVTTYNKKYVKALGLTTSTEAYIQSRILKKTLENISVDYRRGIHEGGSAIDEVNYLCKTWFQRGSEIRNSTRNKVSNKNSSENKLFWLKNIFLFKSLIFFNYR